MMSLATFLEHIDRAIGKRSDNEISRAAGLAGNALARIREDKVPSLERAAKLADAVGLELVVRPKGETIDPFALRWVYLVNLSLVSEGDELIERADSLASILERGLPKAVELFALTPPAMRGAIYELMAKELADRAPQLHTARKRALAKRTWSDQEAAADALDDATLDDPGVAAALLDVEAAGEGILDHTREIVGEAAARKRGGDSGDATALPEDHPDHPDRADDDGPAD